MAVEPAPPGVEAQLLNLAEFLPAGGLQRRTTGRVFLCHLNLVCVSQKGSTTAPFPHPGGCPDRANRPPRGTSALVCGALKKRDIVVEWPGESMSDGGQSHGTGQTKQAGASPRFPSSRLRTSTLPIISLKTRVRLAAATRWALKCTPSADQYSGWSFTRPYGSSTEIPSRATLPAAILFLARTRPLFSAITSSLPACRIRVIVAQVRLACGACLRIV